MPPPPPPSKSYLLVLDTDSEDEEEDPYYPRPAPPSVAPAPVIEESAFRIEEPTVNAPTPAPVTPTTTLTATIASTSSRCRRPHVIEDDNDDDDDDSEDLKDVPTTATGTTNATDQSDDVDDGDSKKLTKNQKKNRSRRKKKKSKRSTSVSNLTDETTAPPEKKLSFSNVSIRSYERCFSADTVPLDGGWPLGLELYQFEDEDSIPLEDFERMRQEVLRERWELIQESGKVVAGDAVYKRMTERPPGVPLLLETRQWDYTCGMKNPLFRPLLEEERQELFLRYSSGDDSCSDMSIASYGTPSLAKARTRSNSVSSLGDISVGSNGSPPKRRIRSNSVSVQFNETYNQVYVHHVRNELEQLRNERTKSGATGCNCRKLSVYIPPKDGSGGKKAQHRRMKPSKVASELKKRGLYDPKASREELEQILHDAVEKEPCCVGNDCFCARNGIDCQADACSCWHDSHVHTKKGSDGNGYVSVQEIKTRCGNPLGTMVVDLTAIDEFRSKLLASEMCQPVGTAMAF